MKNIFVLLILLSLACSSQATIPQAVGSLSDKDGVYLTESAPLEMVVIADSLNIRAEPDENSAADNYGLRRGDVVTVYTQCTGNFVREWVAIDADCTRWVNSKYLEAK